MPNSRKENINSRTSGLAILKTSINTILTDISELERCLYGNEYTAAHPKLLKHEISELLNSLENAPLEHFAKKINKRKQKRMRKKIKISNFKAFLKKNAAFHTPKTALKSTPGEHAEPKAATTQASTICSQTANSSQLLTKKHKPHIRLLKQRDAQRFLRTFELLKMLHLARNQNPIATTEFATKFNNLKAVWGRTLVENAEECRMEERVEDQWNEVFFGPTEHAYYGGTSTGVGILKPNDLLRIRHIWDSYLTRSRHGSSIPCGWILPDENVMSEWQRYIVDTNT